jgi:hypothetical protein
MFFNVFLFIFLYRSTEAYKLIRQLADLAMRKLIDDEATCGKVSGGLGRDINLLTKSSKNAPKKSSFLKRDLDAREMSKEFRSKFQVPNTEMLDGQV